MGFRPERWRLQPLQLPRPWRYCPTCGLTRPFVCSERFRVNAQKKSLDIWLNYRCSSCQGVWKYPLFERQSVAQLDDTLRDAFERNDRALAWKYAFDVARLRSHAVRVDCDIEIRVERTAIDATGELLHACFHLEVPFACDVRLDRLLAAQLQVSRTQLHRLHEARKLVIDPDQRGALRKPVRDGQRIHIAQVMPAG